MFAVVQGRVEVHTSHGETLHFGPGDVLGLSTDLEKPELDFHARTLTDTKIIGSAIQRLIRTKNLTNS